MSSIFHVPILILIVLIASQWWYLNQERTLNQSSSPNIDLGLLSKDCSSQLVKNFYFEKALSQYKEKCLVEKKCGSESLEGSAENVIKQIDELVSNQKKQALERRCNNLIIHSENVQILPKQTIVDPKLDAICGNSTECIQTVHEMIIYHQAFAFAVQKLKLDQESVKRFLQLQITNLGEKANSILEFIRNPQGIEGPSGFSISLKPTHSSHHSFIQSVFYGLMALALGWLYLMFCTFVQVEDDYSKKMAEATRETDELKKKLKEATVKVLEKELEKEKQKIEEYERTITELKNLLSEMNNELMEDKSIELEAELKVVKESNSKLLKCMEERDEQITSLEEEIKGLKSQTETLSEEAKNLKESLKEKDNEVVILTELVKSEDQLLQVDQAEINNLSSIVNQADEGITYLKNDLNTIRTVLASTEEKLNKSVKEKERIYDEYETVQRDVKRLTEEKLEMEKEIQMLKQRSPRTFKSSPSREKEENRRLKEKIELLEKKLKLSLKKIPSDQNLINNLPIINTTATTPSSSSTSTSPSTEQDKDELIKRLKEKLEIKENKLKAAIVSKLEVVERLKNYEADAHFSTASVGPGANQPHQQPQQPVQQKVATPRNNKKNL
ncbi:predicted protein [Naegleria gruberi]|uniref:Predicted protein n=1 Tax=Naegleria gruberi TaxID=5762 RepID=D2VEE5_NAEGR|nr:uncharacterized protein NAEGRDRAFT_67250 [Naegleria gruberi]EFC44786.1 predicted protein [Naegleria gruberi]|eukprot:XP_002677530.1 predicted protein [Naegleria gruberi strain NEG-M]